MRNGIVISGVSCLDLFLYDTSPLVTRESLSLVNNTAYRAGGITSNAGRALAKLGIPVEFLTVIGNDANGDIMLDIWKKDGIDTDTVMRTDTAGTSLSVLPVYKDGKRGVYFCPGTNGIMDAEMLAGKDGINITRLQDKQIFHLGYPPLLNNLQGKNLTEFLLMVKKSGVVVSLDTTPIADDTSLPEMLGDALGVADIFTPNIEEASQTAGIFNKLVKKAHEKGMDIENIITPEELLETGEKLLTYGLPLLVITLGPQGVFICTGSEDKVSRLPFNIAANQRIFVPGYKVTGPINTTGAGDTFTAAFLTGMCKGVGTLSDIARFAHCAGATFVDLSKGPSTFEQVISLLPQMQISEPANAGLAEMM